MAARPLVIVEETVSSSRLESFSRAAPLLIPCVVLFGAVASFFVGWTGTLISYRTNIFRRNVLPGNALNSAAIIAYNAGSTLEYSRPKSETHPRASPRNESIAAFSGNEQLLRYQ
ncbi:hypothetical protein MRX96_026600 [Rhipicephalus microplus]